MNEIAIPKRGVWFAVGLIVLVVGSLWLYPRFFPTSAVWSAEPVVPTVSLVIATGAVDTRARDAAVQGTIAFYSVDYRQGKDAWLDALCIVSTRMGCTVAQNVLAPAFWTGFVTAQTISTVKATAQTMVAERTVASRGNAQAQIWRVQVELSQAWPGQKEPLTQFPALALVVFEEDTWKFERFLTEDEVKALASEEVGQ